MASKAFRVEDMPDPYRDAFGRLLAPLDRLPREQRIAEWARACGRAIGARDPLVADLGRAVLRALHEGLDLEHALGVAPPAGSRRTAAALLRAERVRGLLLQLSVTVGGDSRAARILAGAAPCPPCARALVDELRELRGPRSRNSIVRARAASRGA